MSSATIVGTQASLSFQSIFSYVPAPSKSLSQLYVNTTENEEEKILAEAGKVKVGAAKVVLFTSCFFGLNLASARGENTLEKVGPEYLLCVDTSQKVPLFMRKVKEIAESNDRMETIRKINDFILANHADLYVSTCSCCSTEDKAKYQISNLEKDIKRNVSWLSSDERFAKIQAIFRADKFALLSADLSDSNAMQAIADALKANNLTLDTLYLSNVREYEEHDGKLDSFRSAVEKLKAVATPETLVVDTKVRSGGTHSNEDQIQQLRRGFLETPVKDFFPQSPVPQHTHLTHGTISQLGNGMVIQISISPQHPLFQALMAGRVRVTMQNKF